MLPFDFGNPLVTLGKIFLCYVYWFILSIDLSTKADEFFPVKYRIVEEKSLFRDFFPQKLSCWWLFIFTWKPIKENYHSYEEQNIFGAKRKNYYTTETKARTLDEAKKMIEDHKGDVKWKFDRFFKRPEKDRRKVHEV